MGLRYRRSVRLFPGVRLNFSRSGVSTTVGVRGAGVTFGAHGTHLNVGLPGSGLSYRTRLSAPSASAAPAAAPGSRPTPPDPQGPPPLEPQEREIRSGEISALTSPGLGELKVLINEAAVKRVALAKQISAQEKALARARRRLTWARTFIVRLFTNQAVPRLAQAVSGAEESLGQRRAELEGCCVEVDFGFDEAAQASYAALSRAFEDLRACERIWDITSTTAINRVAERTMATTGVRRTEVRFELARPTLVKSRQQVLRLGNVGGRDLQIFPGFIMMRGTAQDFALIEFRELDLDLSRTSFIEEQRVPSDARVLGQTWKKANKDGSPDRRFKENYAIPIVEYGELSLSSPTGLLEAYQFSRYAATEGFARAFEAHKQALAALREDGPTTPAGVADGGDEELTPDDVGLPAPLMIKPATGLWLDWAALVLIVLGIGSGGIWIQNHASELKAESPPPIESVAPTSGTPAVAPLATSKPKPHHRRLRRHKASPSAGA